jgi:hypothetical protein
MTVKVYKLVYHKKIKTKDKHKHKKIYIQHSVKDLSSDSSVTLSSISMHTRECPTKSASTVK